MSIRLIGGDCREVLATLPANSVHCVVSSPPYYGLRDYGTAQWAGGDANCQHGPRVMGNANKGNVREVLDGDRGKCARCDATRVDRQIGLEPTPDAYLAEMVGVFREIRRVMRHDAVAFINMGDSFANKQLLMMPARLALALQADGWWLRSDIIWHKPNPMPESVTDRPTSAHEHVFLLAKSARYYFDNEAIREPASTTAEAWESKSANWRNGTAKQQQRGDTYHPFKDAKPFENGPNPAGRSCRNVWTIATAPYSEAHFATFPPALAERCIRAGTSERGCCAACGAPWGRETDVSYTNAGNGNNNMKRKAGGDYEAAMSSRPYEVRKLKSVATLGWAPACACGAATVPCTVLDPFAGAGTTMLVADRLQRDAIGIELSPDYTRMAMDRCRDDAPLFASPPPAEDPEEPRIRDLFA